MDPETKGALRDGILATAAMLALAVIAWALGVR